MDLSHVIVCSFYTADDYYRSHAERLVKNLDAIGVGHELDEIVKAPGEDWADICRKKIAFINRVCEENPDKIVFWIDVDCSLLDLPEYVAGSTADLIGFQRGFSTPASIGYANRTRFWEPCFFGVNTTKAARQFMAQAAQLERELDIKATDDYFFEESWRANAPNMTFQVIPSGACVGKSEDGVVTAFFEFGASGNVDDFKGKVAQHNHVSGKAVRRSPRRRALDLAKKAERWISGHSGSTAGRLRAFADRIGITHLLTNGGGNTKRARMVKEMVKAGQRGDRAAVEVTAKKLESQGILSANERANKEAAEVFAHYAGSDGRPNPAISLMWWPRPLPGNFGDWLSPLVLERVSGHPVSFLQPTAPTHRQHLVMIGSIGRFIKPKSIVVGTGVSSEDLALDAKADYLSVRGPVTAELLRNSGGPDVESFGDPGALISRLIPVQRPERTNGRIAFVRHHSHAKLPAVLPEGWDEISVLVSSPEAIAGFAASLVEYDAVVTSAMHVMIACHSYGVPVALVSFNGFEDAVHGTGIKYRDYCLGVGLSTIVEPTPVDLNLTTLTIDDLIHTERLSEAKLDEIEAAVRSGADRYLGRMS